MKRSLILIGAIILLSPTVLPQNNAPVFNSTPITSAEQDQFYNYQITASDADSNVLLFSAPTLPSWLTLTRSPDNINTIAGTGTIGYNGNGGLATDARIEQRGIAIDTAGNIYLAETNNYVVRKIDAATGIISVFAGTGSYGNTGDGGAATSADIEPWNIAVDDTGNVYISLLNFHVIRKIDAATGNISTIAGSSSTPGSSGDGGAATSALLSSPNGLAFDSNGNLYIVDQVNNKIRMIDPGTGNISTIAGTGTAGYSGDGGAATSALLNRPVFITADKDGNIYFAEEENDIIRKVSTGGTISTIAGTGTAGYNGEEGLATSIQLNNPEGVVVDAAGNIIFADMDNNIIRKVDAGTGNISTISGIYDEFSPTGGYSGDGGPAIDAELGLPQALMIDAGGNIYISDVYNGRLRKISVINEISGTPLNENTGINNVVLEVSDGADQVQQDFDIDVANVNDAPVAKADTILLDENTASTTSLGTVDASDIDGGDILSYSIIEGNTDNAFTINTSTGEITVLTGSALDYETTRAFFLSVLVEDNGTPSESDTALISILLNNLNDNSPEFTTTEITSATEDVEYTYVFLAQDADEDTLEFTAPTLPGWLSLKNDVINTLNGTFSEPKDLAIDQDGNIYVSDNSYIHKIDYTSGDVTIVAGTGVSGYSGDGGLAVSAQINTPLGMEFDNYGDLYFADYGNHCIRKIDMGTGFIQKIAGTGVEGYSGDGGLAVSAQLGQPRDMVFDAHNNMYFTDPSNDNNIVRKIEYETGVISLYAGTPGGYGYSGDGGPATSANFRRPWGIAIDDTANLYIFDGQSYVIRKIYAETGIINTIAGTGTAGYSGDGDLAINAQLEYIFYMDLFGDQLYLPSYNHNVLRKIDLTTNIISTIFGTGNAGYSGDGELAINAEFSHIYGVANGIDGKIYVTDSWNGRVRRTEDLITGTPLQTDIGDNSVILQVGDGSNDTQQSFTISVAGVNDPPVIVADTFYIDENSANSTSVGTVSANDEEGGTMSYFILDGNTNNAFLLNSSTGELSVQTSSELDHETTPAYFLEIKVQDDGTPFASDSLIITVLLNNLNDNVPVFFPPDTIAYEDMLYLTDQIAADADGDPVTITANTIPAWLAFGEIISTIAGTGTEEYSGDGVAAIDAAITEAYAIAFDGAGNLYFSDHNNHRVRKINKVTGIISTVAGNGFSSCDGGGGQATSSYLAYPEGIAFDSNDDLYIAGCDRIRKVNMSNGTISTYAGNGSHGYTGDGGAATSASLASPWGINFDSDNNLYIAEQGNHVIRKVDATTGIITTIAGTGTGGFSGDGGLATSAQLNDPRAVDFDTEGNIYIAEGADQRIRKIDIASGNISTIAGTGSEGYGGDGGLAISATFGYPSDIHLDEEDNIFIADLANQVIRRIDAGTSIITTVAGTGTDDFGGDGGLATSADLNYPTSVELDASGNIYIGDRFNYRIRCIRIQLAGTPVLADVGDHAVSFEASDGVTTVTSDFTITVEEVNDAPVISAGTTFNIDENSSPGTSLTTKTATDEEGNSFWFSIISGNTNNTFAIDSASGELTVADSTILDHETHPVFTLTIQAEDDGTPPSQGILEISVTVDDVNDAPDVSATVLSVDENSAVSTVVGTVTASDDDGDDISYSITGGNTGNAFTIDSNTGQITVLTTAPLDNETMPEFILSITVQEVASGNLTGTGEVTININNINEFVPVFTTAALTEANEDHLYNYSFAASDADGDAVSYTVPTLPAWALYNYNEIMTVAGNGNYGYSGDEGSAVYAELNRPWGFAFDSLGDLYFTDNYSHVVRKIDTAGMISTIAGQGYSGTGADSIAAISTTLYYPRGIAIDDSGNIYVADAFNNRVRKIDALTGIITTYTESYRPSYLAFDSQNNLFFTSDGNIILKVNSVTGVTDTIAGTGVAGFSGNDGLAIDARIFRPAGLVFDDSDNIYFCDKWNHRIRKIDAATGIITTIAGTGISSYSGDGGPAISARLKYPTGITLDANDNIYFSDNDNHRIRKIDINTGIINTIAGTGTPSYSGDGGWATNATVNSPEGVIFDATGNLLIADFSNNCIRRIETGWKITGTPTVSEIGDHSVTIQASDGAANAQQNFTITVNEVNDAPIVIVDTFYINENSPVLTSIGTVSADDEEGDSLISFSVDSCDITGAFSINDSTGLIVVADSSDLNYEVNPVIGLYVTTLDDGSPNAAGEGIVYIALNDLNDTPFFLSSPVTETSEDELYTYGLMADDEDIDFITFDTLTLPAWLTLERNTAKTISTFSGTGVSGSSGDGDTAFYAQLNHPTGVAVDGENNVYIADNWNNLLRKVDAVTGIITTIAGTGTSGSSGDGGLAVNALINGPDVVVTDIFGNIYFTESHKIRRIDAKTGIISTLAGSTSPSYSGDGGLATVATLYNPSGLAVDRSGNLYISDTYNNRVRMIDGETGIITTIAGTGTALYSGDNGPATNATLSYPAGLAFDKIGNLYVAERNSNVVRKIDTSGIITTIAGTSVYGYAGDGGHAILANLATPYDITFDVFGNMYIADRGNSSIRMVDPSGIISTIAGQGSYGYSGDDGPATDAKFRYPSAVAIDNTGTIYVTDENNNRVRNLYGSDYVLTGTPGYEFNGDNDVILRVSDGTLSSQQSFTVNVLAVNDAPIVYSDTFNIDENSVTGSLVDTVSAFDEEGDRLEFAITAGDTSNIFSINDSTGIISVADSSALNYEVLSEYRLVVQATETLPGDLSGTDTIIIIINNMNDTPVFTSDPVTDAVEDSLYTYTITSSDEDNNALTISTPTLPSWLMINTTPGNINTVAGTGTYGYVDDDGSLATQIDLGHMRGIAFDSENDIYFTESNRVHKVDATTGILITIAGSSSSGYSGDGGPATEATLTEPFDIDLDASGNIYFADRNNHVVRKIDISTGIISTIAGTGSDGYGGDGGQATSALLYYPSGIAIDDSDNIYIADNLNSRIRKIDAGSGVITTYGGTGVSADNGDGGLATDADIIYPRFIDIDDANNLYIATGQRVRKIDPVTGIITAFAGSSMQGNEGDGGQATDASLYWPNGIANDGFNNVYVVSNQKIRKIDNSSGIISTVAGSEDGTYSGDGGPAVFAELYTPQGLAVDGTNNLYIADGDNYRIRKIDVSTFISGIPRNDDVGDNDVVLQLNDGMLETLQSFTISVEGVNSIPVIVADSFYIDENSNPGSIVGTVEATDPENEKITFTVLSGNTDNGFTINDSTGVITVADASAMNFETNPAFNLVIRVSETGSGGLADSAAISIFLNNVNEAPVFTSVPVTEADMGMLYTYELAAEDEDDDALVFTTPTAPSWLKINTEPGNIETVAGTGTHGWDEDSSLAVLTDLGTMKGIAFDSENNMYFSENKKVHKVHAKTGILTTVAGLTYSGNYGDGGPASEATLTQPYDIDLDASGNIYFTDRSDHVVRKIDISTGIITTIAGTGIAGYTGDGGQATSAQLNNPVGIAIDDSDNIYIADYQNNRIRKIDAVTGVITTYGGTGVEGDNGDGGLATDADILIPNFVAIDDANNLYITTSQRVRKIDPVTGIITTFAGSYNQGNEGDGGPAVEASLYWPTGLAIDDFNNVYVVSLNKIRRIDGNTGIISTVAGSENATYSGDGGPAINAEFFNPYGLATDMSNNLYIADRDNYRIRKIDVSYKVSGFPTFNDIGENNVVLETSDGMLEAQQNFTVTVGGVSGYPDLTISEISDFPMNINPGDEVILTTKVENLGGAAGSFTLKYFLSENTSYEPTDVFIDYVIIDGLDAGTFITVSDTIIFSAGNSGIWNLIFYVDPADAIAEFNENNNTSFVMIDVSTSIEDISEQIMIRLYPNPGSGIFTLEMQASSSMITGLYDDEIKLEIVNLVGEVVYNRNIRVSSGHVVETIDISECARSVYFVKLKTSRGLIVRRLVIQ